MTVEFSRTSTLFAAGPQDEPVVDRIAKKLEGFSNLEPGWHFGEGGPVDPSAIRIAKDILPWASQLALYADVFPGLEGECMVAFYYGEDCVRVVVYPGKDDAFGLRVQRRQADRVANVIEPVEDVTRWSVYQEVTRLFDRDPVWTSLASFTSENSTILASEYSLSSLSNDRPATASRAARPSSTPDARAR